MPAAPVWQAVTAAAHSIPPAAPGQPESACFPFPRSLTTHLADIRQQAMYGVVHGGLSLELRQRSIDYLTSLPFDGFAVGGSLGKNRRGAGLYCVCFVVCQPECKCVGGLLREVAMLPRQSGRLPRAQPSVTGQTCVAAGCWPLQQLLPYLTAPDCTLPTRHLLNHFPCCSGPTCSGCWSRSCRACTSAQRASPSTSWASQTLPPSPRFVNQTRNAGWRSCLTARLLGSQVAPRLAGVVPGCSYSACCRRCGRGIHLAGSLQSQSPKLLELQG